MPLNRLSSTLGPLLLACLTAGALAAAEHHGVVESGGLPIPGATVSATQGDKKFVTTTDDQGAYGFPDLAEGTWTIQVEMFGFAPLTQEVGIAPGAPSPQWQLNLLPLGTLRQELSSHPEPTATPAAQKAQTPETTSPPAVAANSDRPNRGGFGGRGGFRGGRGGAEGRPSIRQALQQNPADGFQQLDVNAAAGGNGADAENDANGSADNTFANQDLTQSASNSLVVNGSVSSGLGIPQQNDWFGFGRGFGDGFGPGGPGGPGGFGGPGGAPPGAVQQADAGGAGGGGGFGGGGGRGGFGGGGGGRGGFGGGRGGFRGGRGGFRGPRNFNAFGNGRRNRRNEYRGNLAFIVDNSALDARPYSLTGQDTPKAAYNKFRSTGFLGGPLKIPHLLSGENTFFTLNYQLTRSRNANTASTLVPTADEISGDFSQAVDPITRKPITIADPNSCVAVANPVPKAPPILQCQPFPGNKIPAERITNQAKTLLNPTLHLYPLPNFGNNPIYNYQVPLVSTLNQSNVNSRISQTINARNQFNGNFAWQSATNLNPNVLGFRDSTSMTGYNTGLTYTYHFTTRVISNLRYNFSRQAINLTPFFANNQNVSGPALGILGNYQSPQFYGPPTLAFGNGFASLTDGNYSQNHNTTNQIGESLLWVRAAHTVTFGADYRRLDFNQFSQQNPRGSFTFANTIAGYTTDPTTGARTATTPFTSFDFANFLLGVPSSSAIAYGNADKYFRQSWLDTFVTDDWRINSRVSVNLGLRWDFQGPVTELYNRLVNPAVAANFAGITPVCGTNNPAFFFQAGAQCTLAGAMGYPNSLVRPDYREFQPRIGLAWRPFAKASTVVRAGYGIYYNTSVYQGLTAQMAQQSPLSHSVTQPNSIEASAPQRPYLYSMADAFGTSAINSTPETFALDPNFRIGYLHYWQLSIQQNLPANFVATVTYNGDKGTHQLQEFLPNTFPQGIPTDPSLAGYVYVSSGANSNYNAISGQLQRRFRGGLSGNIVYTFSKAIDDAQGIGGRGGALATYAQNWLDLSAERSLSSFSRAQTLNMFMQWSTGQGVAGGTLVNGWRGALVKDWTFTTQVVVGTGLPETPIVLNRLAAGTGIAGTVRADYVGGSLAPIAPGQGFNPLAFAPTSDGQWGDAGRNIITGPGQFSLNASAGRVFRISDRRSFDLRFDSTNLLNHVTFTSWNTTYGSAQFGLPAAVSGMRTMQASLRFRF